MALPRIACATAFMLHIFRPAPHGGNGHPSGRSMVIGTVTGDTAGRLEPSALSDGLGENHLCALGTMRHREEDVYSWSNSVSAAVTFRIEKRHGKISLWCGKG
jgi:hypothetical protein